MPSKPQLNDVAKKEARDEITDYTIYKLLSKNSRDTEQRTVFKKISEMEMKHYKFWMDYCDGSKIEANHAKVWYMLLIRHLMGASFTIKYLEGSESATIKKYEKLRSIIPKNKRKVFESIINDEIYHEAAFANQIQTSYTKYVSFIVLGLADALVEIAGIHAGSLGIYDSTFLTGLAGVIAGAAASISMASAAYAQAKQGFGGSARMAASYTGVSYFLSAVILAFPYFIIPIATIAMVSSLILGMLMIFFTSWYNSIMSGGSLKKDFFELAGVMIGATIVLFILGFVIRSAFGITL